MANCNNCFQNRDWCGCDVYFEFAGKISAMQAKEIKAKRNKLLGLKNPNAKDSY